MNEALKQEIIGRSAVFVSLGGQPYRLEFPMHAVILYRQLSGDNLFDGECWKKIAPLEDPERFIACLWAGLHRFEDGKWMVPFSREQLEMLVDFQNVTPTCEAVALALASYFPKAKPLGETALQAQAEASSEPSPSPNSGPSLVTISD